MKPKRNYVPGPQDCCQTPAYAVAPLLPYLRRDWQIWEPAAGKRSLAAGLEAAGYRVASSDISDDHPIDFFTDPRVIDCDAIVTNPPYSIKYPWLARCYEIGKPFALLVPVETIGAKAAQDLFQRYGFELLLLNRRVNFEMPNKGTAGGGAQFPVLWLCWRLLGAPVRYGEIIYPGKEKAA